MRASGVILLITLASCSGAPPPRETVCRIAQAPETFLGKSLTVSGLAKVSRHEIILSDPACPGLALDLYGSPDTVPFFSALAATIASGGAPVRVTVTGQLVATTSEVPSYEFGIVTGVAH